MSGYEYIENMGKYNDEMDEVMNLLLDEDPGEDWVKTFEMSREIERAFPRYEISYEINLFKGNDVLLQISESRLVVGNLLQLNLPRLRGIKAFETFSVTFEK